MVSSPRFAIHDLCRHCGAGNPRREKENRETGAKSCTGLVVLVDVDGTSHCERNGSSGFEDERGRGWVVLSLSTCVGRVWGPNAALPDQGGLSQCPFPRLN